jgi:CheY-like chemotaxis protein
MKTILFVEDDPIIIQVYRGPLKNAGYRVEIAEDGLAAMRVILQLRPDLVLLDVLMPKMDGTYVLKFIHDRPDFLRSQSTPKELVKVVHELLGGEPAPAG